MFKVTTAPEFTHEVHPQVPVDGGFEEQSFKARFRVESEKANALDLADSEAVKTFLRTVVVEFFDLVDLEQKPVTYNDALRDQMLSLPYVRLALLRAYSKAMVKERQGN